MPIIANALLALTKTVASFGSSKLEIVIKDSEIEYRYAKPKSTKNRVWEDFYKNAGIYIDGFAQPIQITRKNAREANLVTTEYYKELAKLDMAKDLYTTDSDDWDLQTMILAGILGVGIIGLLAFIGMVL